MARQTSGLSKFFDIEESVVDATTRFLGAKTRHLYDWWVANAGGGMPLRRMFDIVDHKAIVPNVFLVDVTADGNFVFRLLGEEVIQMIGWNRTGEVVRSGAVGEWTGNRGRSLGQPVRLQRAIVLDFCSAVSVPL